MANNVLEYWIRARDATSAVLKSATQKVEQFGNRIKQTFSGVAKESGAERLAESVIHTEYALDKLALGLDRIGVEGEQFRECMDVMERAMNDLNRGNIKAADLFEITKLSMADVGMTAKQVEQTLQMLKSCMVQDVSVSGKDVSRGLRSEFKGVHGIVSALNGNVFALGRSFTWLLGHIKKLNLSSAMLSGIGIAVYSVTEAVSKCVSWWREKKKKLEEIKALRFEETLKRYSEVQKEVSNAVSDYNDKLDREIERKRKLIEQNERLKAQEIERLRIAELASAKSNDERDAINREFDAQQAQNKAEAAIAKARMEIETGQASADKISELVEPLKAESANLKKMLDAADAEADKRRKQLEDTARNTMVMEHGVAGSSHLLGMEVSGPRNYYRKRTESEVEEYVSERLLGDDDWKKLTERREKLKAQYESIASDIKGFEKRVQRERDRVEDATREIENIDAEFDIDQWRDQEEAMHSYYEEMARLEEEAARQAERDAEAQARLEKQFHEERMRAAEDEYRQSAKMQSDAEGRLAAAQSKVAEAWGFYRDKGKMQEAIDEYRAQQEAEQQWAKDFEKLRNKRRDWRDVEFGQLSAEEEAVRQVALAKEEERAAQVALDAINEQTARAADAVEEIHKILANGGEP